MSNVSYNNTTAASPGLQVPCPGVPVANLPGAQPLQVGCFPPGANSAGATSTLAECSRGTLPINVLITNEGTPAVPLSASLSGIGGQGGANTNGGNAVVGDVSLGAQAAPQNLSLAGGTAATQYGG
jgi:hypothetical protein